MLGQCREIAHYTYASIWVLEPEYKRLRIAEWISFVIKCSRQCRIEQAAEKVDMQVQTGVMLSEARLRFGARSRSTPTNAGTGT
jgi:hypothetical protein